MKKFIWSQKLLKNKRGGSTLFELVIGMGLITFILFYPIATFTLIQKENMLEDVLTTSMQMVSVEGGLTDRVQNLIVLNLQNKKLLPASTDSQYGSMLNQIHIECNADARNGNTSNLVYMNDDDPTIYIQIEYPADKDVEFLNGLAKLVGASSAEIPYNTGTNGSIKWYYKMGGYILSEKVNY